MVNVIVLVWRSEEQSRQVIEGRILDRRRSMIMLENTVTSFAMWYNGLGGLF